MPRQVLEEGSAAGMPARLRVSRQAFLALARTWTRPISHSKLGCRIRPSASSKVATLARKLFLEFGLMARWQKRCADCACRPNSKRSPLKARSFIKGTKRLAILPAPPGHLDLKQILPSATCDAKQIRLGQN